MRHRVTLRRTITTQDDWGDYTASIVQDIATMWASIEPVRGAETESDSQLRADMTHRIVVRADSDTTIAPTYRLGFGSREFEILELRDVEERGIRIELMCKEIVE